MMRDLKGDVSIGFGAAICLLSFFGTVALCLWILLSVIEALA